MEEHNRRLIVDDTNMKGEMVRGALRKGEALLAGLLRCGQCGRKLHVGYTGKNGNTSRYICRGASINHGASGKRMAFDAIRINQGVSAEVLRLLMPVGVEAALHAIEQCAGQGHAKRRQAELSLEQSRFEAGRAQRQFDAVDPGNRLVVGVRVTDTHLELMVHWQGGDHTELSIVRNQPGKHLWTTDIEVEQLLMELARLLPDRGIASLLNRQGHRTCKGHTWTEASVLSFRGSHHVAVFRAR